MKASRQLKFILSGGGTGGHIFPAVSIANELKKTFPDSQFLFVGAEGKMEMEKVPKAGYEIIGLPIVGLQRRLTFKNLLLPFKLISSLLKARKIIKSFNPDIAIGTGGFASGPVLRMATRLGIPTLIQEQNSFAGITNKILAKKVNTICVAYENMDRYFPRNKIVFTGNPIRQDIADLKVEKKESFDFFKLQSDKKTLLIIGGSLGALTINKSIEKGLEEIQKNDIQIIWQTGKSYFSKAKELESKFSNLRAYDFISRMDFAYNVADLIISRAGASSVSEICAVAKASILVPSPNVAEDHQTKNAMALVNKNATILVKDAEAENNLINVAINLLSDEKKCTELATNANTLAVKNSAELIVQEIKKILSVS
ncbi:MAG: undecaprenyldiphospho-muramoylpentapeptide beta-N-acetylglucosaminyltransferase [Bacteroidia bacterium]